MKPTDLRSLLSRKREGLSSQLNRYATTTGNPSSNSAARAFTTHSCDQLAGPSKITRLLTETQLEYVPMPFPDVWILMLMACHVQHPKD